MSEKKPFDTENIKNETVEGKIAEGGDGQAERENAPREKIAPEKPRSKKRKGGKIYVRFAAILLVIALVFGAVLGFALGRAYARNQLIEAQIAIDELTARVAELEGSWNDDEADGLTDENIDALNLLYGDGEGDIFGDDEAPTDFETGAESVVVAEFKGGELMSDEVYDSYNERVAGYIFSGYTEDEIPESLLDELLEEKAQEKVLMLKAQELGVYDLTDADRAEIAAEAENSFNELISVFSSYIDTEGKSEDSVIAETKAYLSEYEGVSYDSVYEMIGNDWWMQKLYDEVVKDVKIESTAIIELYNEKLSSQQANFTEYPENFEAMQMNGETIVYNLEGYRAVKLLCVSSGEPGAAENAVLIEEEIAGLDAQSDAERISQYQAELDDIYAPAEESMQGILNQIEGGASFEDMLSQYGEDIGMQSENLQKTGYYVSEKSVLWPEEMIRAAFSLQNAGDISEPFRMNGSVCILQYMGEVPAGAISVDEMYDVISAEALENARSEAYDQQISQWIDEANIEYYPERMR